VLGNEFDVFGQEGFDAGIGGRRACKELHPLLQGDDFLHKFAERCNRWHKSADPRIVPSGAISAILPGRRSAVAARSDPGGVRVEAGIRGGYPAGIATGLAPNGRHQGCNHCERKKSLHPCSPFYGLGAENSAARFQSSVQDSKHSKASG
jgi:hypothetical protein